MRKSLHILLVLTLLFIGCAKEPEPATPITWDQISGDYLKRRVSLEGYLAVPRSVMATDTMLLPLKQNLEDEEAAKIRFSTKIGSGSNQVEKLPKGYKESDLKLRSKDGELVAPNSKLRVSGKLIGDEKAWVLMGPLVVEKI